MNMSKEIKNAFKQIAEECQTTSDEVEREIAVAIKYAWSEQNTILIKANQNKVPCSGHVPTNEELMRYIIERIKNPTSS